MLKELTLTFVLALVCLNLVLMTESLLKLTKLFSSVGASFFDMLRIIAYLQPQLSALTMPMALFIAVLLTYGRQNADNEITVMRTCGMSFVEISRPVFLLGTACILLGVGFGFYIAPLAAARVKAAVADTVARRAHFAVEEGIFNTTFKDVVIYVRDKPSENALKGIFLYDERKSDQPRVLFAKGGTISSDGYNISLDLMEGQVRIVKGRTSTGLSFGRYRLMLPVSLDKPSRKWSELSPAALLREASASEGKKKAVVMLEFWRRLTLPFMSVVLMFLGPPLALRSGRAGKFGGLAVGLSVFCIYYAAMVYAENLSMSGRLPLLLGAWSPALLLGALAFWIFRREALK